LTSVAIWLSSSFHTTVPAGPNQRWRAANKGGDADKHFSATAAVRLGQ
jgi:hypothetical protein